MPGNNWLKKRTIVYSPPERGTRHGGGESGRPAPMKRFGGAAWRALKKTAMAVGFVTLIWLFISGWALFSLVNAGDEPLPEEMILYWGVDSGLLETPGDPSLAKPLEEKPTLHTFVRALDRAALDPRVKGLVLDYRGGAIALAHIEELHAAIRRFRESGKPAYFYAADLSGGLGPYYLATAFDEIWMQPVGSLVVNGINLETPYVKDVLDQIGVSAQFYRRKEYKTLYESATHSEMTPAQREMMTTLVSQLGENILTTIAAGRDMPPERVMEAIDMGILTDEEALASGLIDRLAYGRELVAYMREAVSGNAEAEEPPMIGIESYGNRSGHAAKNFPFTLPAHEEDSGSRVALIYVSGMILPEDSSGAPPIMGGNVVSANRIAGVINEAAKDGDVEAIVLRVDSPGGSPSAAETIRWALVNAKNKGKPVIVSMGPMAASGGYWVSAPADRIFALPTTMTGSIGVVSGKIVLAGLWDKLDVNWESVEWGRNADIWSMNAPFGPAAEQRMNAMVDNIYASFVRVVAEGRGMAPERVDEIARGYVWTGRGAIEAGLVDELGGLDAAMDYVARSLGHTDRRDLAIEIMPRPQTTLERLLNLFGAEVSASRALKAQATALQMFAPFLEEAAYLRGARDMTTLLHVKAP
ncbi:MAG: signal peptide peptidase SppA [Alphaproteobacteria bacterium]|nr:signal peptide peptidase SppA [Alphaproteobacteria bacterium]